MTTSQLYLIINALPLPVWLAWILAPHSSLARYFARVVWPWAALAAVYVLLIGTAMFIVEGKPEANMATLAGVMAIFDSEWATLAAWMHYLCFDLFAARWIVNDARPTYWLAPILCFTLMFGPVGLLMYLGARRWLRVGAGS